MPHYFRLSLILLTLFEATFFLNPTRIYASEGMERGGEGALVTPDGHVDLADSHIKRFGKSFDPVSPEVRKALNTYSKLLVRYGANYLRNDRWRSELSARTKDSVSSESAISDESEFITKHVLHPLNEFRDVNDEDLKILVHIDPTCNSSARKRLVTQFGCSNRYLAWIVRSKFVALTPEDQALELVRIKLAASYSQLSESQHLALIRGLKTAYQILARQLAGDRTRLTDTELDALRKFVEAIFSSGLSRGRLNAEVENFLKEPNIPDAQYLNSEFGKSWGIAPHGGLYHLTESQLDPTSFLGVAAILGPKGKLEEGAVLIDISCYMPRKLGLAICSLGKNAVAKSILWYQPGFKGVKYLPGKNKSEVSLTLAESAHLEDSTLINIKKIILESGSTLKSASLIAKTVTPDYSWNDLPFDVRIETGASFLNSEPIYLNAPSLTSPWFKVRGGKLIDLQNQRLCRTKISNTPKGPFDELVEKRIIYQDALAIDGEASFSNRAELKKKCVLP